MDGLFPLILVGGFLGSMAFVVTRATPRSSSRTVSAHEAPEADGLPFSRRNHFFSAAERSFYEILRRITPEHTVFAKVRLAELVSIQGTVSRQAHLNRIDRKHIDFVVCDKNMAPVVAIELDDASQDRADRRVRDEFLDEVLAAASLPVIHLRRGCVLDEVHRLLSPYLRIGTPLF